MMMLTCKKKFKLETVNIGLKIFQKNKENKSEGDYRVVQEGLEILLPHLDSRRIVKVDAAFFTTLASKSDKKLTFDEIKTEFSDTLSEKFKSLTTGSAIMQFSNPGQMEANSITIWIGRNNVMLMIGAGEIKSLQLHATKSK